jgi:hypothetical protein
MPVRGFAVYGVLCLAAICQAAQAAPAGTIELDHATLVATINGWPQPPQEIRLPLHWDVIWRGRSGTARLTLPFPRPGANTADGPLMLFIPRIANAYSVELNGTVLARLPAIWGARRRVVSGSNRSRSVFR